jgi:hypothetical protein
MCQLLPVLQEARDSKGNVLMNEDVLASILEKVQ